MIAAKISVTSLFKTKLGKIFIVAALMLFVVLVLGSSPAHASDNYRPCGVQTGNTQHYGGAIMAVNYVDAYGNLSAPSINSNGDAIKFRVETIQTGTGPTGNAYGGTKIKQAETNGYGVLSGTATANADFNLVAGCTLAGYAAVMGYNFTSPGYETSRSSLLYGTFQNRYVLDCDATRHGTSTNAGQPFQFSIANVSTQRPQGSSPNGSWTAPQILHARNGSNVNATFTYVDPPIEQYQVGSYLLEGVNPRDGSGHPPMPDGSVSNVSYGSQANAIINSNNATVGGSDNTSVASESYRSLTAKSDQRTRVYAPHVITRNGVAWDLEGSAFCNVTVPSNDCRDSGGSYQTFSQMNQQVGGTYGGRKYREISQGWPANNPVRVYWYYKPSVAAPTCTLTANPTSITVPNSSRLTWTLGGGTATSISINQGIGNRNLTPNYVDVSPTTNTTYTATVSGDGGSGTCSTTVTVNTNPAATCTLTANPGTITEGGGTTLTYTTTNATSFVISPATGINTPASSTPVNIVVFPSSTTTYTGTAYGSGASGTCNVQVTVNPVPSCTLTDRTIRTGENGTLTWTTSGGATSLSINNGIGSVSPLSTGTVTITTPADTVNYTGTVTGAGGTTRTCTGSITVIADWPYLRIYGNDAVAGSSFKIGDVCPANTRNSGIKAHATTDATTAQPTNTTDWKGSSVQFGLFSLKSGSSSIDGFYSSNLRNSDPKPRYGNTFGNFNGAPVSDFGGDSGSVHCIPDYVKLAKDASPALSPLPSTTPGFTNLSGQNVGYRSGDLTINGNVTYANATSGWSNTSSIPSLVVIVEGDIYIDKGVTQLDGIYIAQPKLNSNGTYNSGGHIYTCTNGSNKINLPSSTIRSDCNTKLTINGSFMAQNIHFLRTKGNLQDHGVALEGQNSANIAEVFNFSPEVYMSKLNSVFKKPGGGISTDSSVTKFDYITNLPPVL